jgi:hypothetical protein
LLKALKADAKQSFRNPWDFGWSKDAMRGQLFGGPKSVREFFVD